MYFVNYNFVKILLLILFISITTTAQQDTITHKSIRLELGVGAFILHRDIELSARGAFSFVGTNYGITIRATANSGDKGIVLSHDWLTFGPPIEWINEFAFLGSLVVYQTTSFQVLSNLGLGILHGEKLTKSQTDLERFKNEKGFAFEIGFASAGSSLGYLINFFGDINSITNFYALSVSISIGYQK